jgi:hypothetical protein
LDNDVAKLLVFSPDVLSSLGCCMQPHSDKWRTNCLCRFC